MAQNEVKQSGRNYNEQEYSLRKIMLIVWIATPTGWLAMTVPASTCGLLGEKMKGKPP